MPNSSNRIRVGISLRPREVAKLQALAAKEQLTFTALATQVLRKWLEEQSIK